MSPSPSNASSPIAAPRANPLTQLTKVREFALLVFIVVLALILSVTSSSFASTGNLIAVALGLASSGIVATGMLVTLAAGGVDLSVGSVLALGGVIAAVAVNAGVPVPLAFVLAILCGSLIGLINGLLITRVGINPLITTLGTMGIARGAAYVITQGSPIGGLPDSFGYVGQNDFLGLPLPVWVLAAVVLIADFLMRRLAWARQVYYVGGNEAAARLSGIAADRVKLRVSVICSTLAALAGVLSASRFSVAAPSEGLGIELIAIAGGVIGGASLAGGQGRVLGAFLGVLLVAMVNNAMVLYQVPVYWQQMVSGSILLVAVTSDILSQQLRRRRALRVTRAAPTA